MGRNSQDRRNLQTGDARTAGLSKVHRGMNGEIIGGQTASGTRFGTRAAGPSSTRPAGAPPNPGQGLRPRASRSTGGVPNTGGNLAPNGMPATAGNSSKSSVTGNGPAYDGGKTGWREPSTGPKAVTGKPIYASGPRYDTSTAPIEAPKIKLFTEEFGPNEVRPMATSAPTAPTAPIQSKSGEINIGVGGNLGPQSTTPAPSSPSAGGSMPIQPKSGIFQTVNGVRVQVGRNQDGSFETQESVNARGNAPAAGQQNPATIAPKAADLTPEQESAFQATMNKAVGGEANRAAIHQQAVENVTGQTRPAEPAPDAAPATTPTPEPSPIKSRNNVKDNVPQETLDWQEKARKVPAKSLAGKGSGLTFQQEFARDQAAAEGSREKANNNAKEVAMAFKAGTQVISSKINKAVDNSFYAKRKRALAAAQQ